MLLSAIEKNKRWNLLVDLLASGEAITDGYAVITYNMRVGLGFLSYLRANLSDRTFASIADIYKYIKDYDDIMSWGPYTSPDQKPVNKSNLNVYACTYFMGHQPTQTAAIIVAENEEAAAHELFEMLKAFDLTEKNKDMTPEFILIDATQTGWYMLSDGEY